MVTPKPSCFLASMETGGQQAAQKTNIPPPIGRRYRLHQPTTDREVNMTPTARSLKQLREDGWHAEVVERWIPGANIRKDLFGFADVLCVRHGSRPCLVQVTASAVADRVKKVRASPLLALALEHFDIEVHGWRKNAKGRWTQRVETIG
jgi:hypothetical protein